MLKWKLPSIEYTKDVSMFRKFTNVIAGTGAVFAALHVFIGFMSFDGEIDETTGEVPRFFDEPEYRYYFILALLFALTAVASALFRRLPALTLLPSAVTTAYLLLLFDVDLLTEGKMTFILFSLFVLVGNIAVALYAKGAFQRELYRYVICFLGLFAAGWAIALYFRAGNAAELLYGTMEPIEALDGLSAVMRYERLKALVETAEAEDAVHYLRAGLCQILAVAALLFLPRVKPLVRIIAVLNAAYVLILFTWGELSYFPMFFVVPVLVYTVGALAFCAVGGLYTETEAPAGPAEIPDGASEASVADTDKENA